MNSQENPEPMNQTVEIEDLTPKTASQQEVRGGNGGIRKVGTGTLILQGDNAYYG